MLFFGRKVGGKIDKYIYKASNSVGRISKCIDKIIGKNKVKKIEKDTEKNPGRPGIYRFAIACLVFQACFLSFISAPGINAMAVHGGNIAYAEDFNYSQSNHGYEMNVPGENDSEENDSYGYSVISGIVEENNPILGYIAIYNPSLPVQGMQAAGREEMLQVLNYLDPDKVDVLKNHKKAGIESVEEGDTVFIKLDKDGYVVSISSVSNYTVKYAKVLYKSKDSIIVEYDGDKTQEILRINDDAKIFAKGALADLSFLENGDRVKMLLHKGPWYTNVKEIIIEEGDRNIISNVYKGQVGYINDMSGRIYIKNLLVLDREKWVRAGIKGYAGFDMAEEFSIFCDGAEMDIDAACLVLRNREVYMAVGKDFGGNERVRLISARNPRDTEIIYIDKVLNNARGSRKLTIDREIRDIFYSSGSIIIKEGRLVQGSSISEEDTVCIAANRNNYGDLMAGIIMAYHEPLLENLDIYRARIKSIEDNTCFTVESYSRLDGVNWEYNASPKTFNITFDTRILDEEGLVNQDDFTGYGEGSYVNKVVYIVADGLNAVVVSTAPYGTYNARGEVYGTAGGATGQEGGIIGEPDEIRIAKAKIYDTYQKKWIDGGEMKVRILKNTVILKNGMEIKPSMLRKGDTVRLIKNDVDGAGDAYIILVED
ncbi:MAG: hypothetical protein GX754_02810 [Clostridiaceae bacterium]|nr:hypothetical protein [Clostridiaceae bacterium]